MKPRILCGNGPWAACASLGNVFECDAYCTLVEKFAAKYEVCALFMNMPAWPGISASRSTAPRPVRAWPAIRAGNYFGACLLL
jgi:hypothetical protein